MKPYAIRGGTIFDPLTGVATASDSILIDSGGRLDEIDGRKPGRGVRELDASGLSIVPGLIDLHVHFGAPVGDDVGRATPLLVLDYARARPRHRRSFLRSGVTTVRSVGDVIGARGDILAVRRRAQMRASFGPSVFTTGPLFTAPGGHPVGTIFRGNDFLIRHATRQVSGITQALTEVDAVAEYGVDGIKLVYDDFGGRCPRLPLEIIHALANRAHELGLWVAIHTRSADEVGAAASAGADTIEHGATDGTLIGTAVIDEIARRDITYVPTLGIVEAVANLARAGVRPPYFPEDQWRDLREHFGRHTEDPLAAPGANVRALAARGVRIGAGTDASGPAMTFGASLHHELELLVSGGLDPATALRAATLNAAQALRIDHERGRVVPGARADVVLIRGRPWDTITDIRRVAIVIRAGEVVADAGSSRRSRFGIDPRWRSSRSLSKRMK